jgi:hypothetical protein
MDDWPRSKKRSPPQPEAFFCHPFTRRRRRPSRRPDDAGPRGYRHHPDLHPCGPSSSWWTPTKNTIPEDNRSDYAQRSSDPSESLVQNAYTRSFLTDEARLRTALCVENRSHGEGVRKHLPAGPVHRPDRRTRCASPKPSACFTMSDVLNNTAATEPSMIANRPTMRSWASCAQGPPCWTTAADDENHDHRCGPLSQCPGPAPKSPPEAIGFHAPDPRCRQTGYLEGVRRFFPLSINAPKRPSSSTCPTCRNGEAIDYRGDSRKRHGQISGHENLE